uniref:Myosin motor domain-containing protein n=1 Tax=Chromera velia CCMP2878 TaxID=1169474 RepID=A0A0G4I5R4_9ALVE|eukprot:Cvel_56.t1-p1 / transcript=Cvel_56.t1 / gene=Cvel_56 / organism=Chromera_velia_CCMP2878 / gene_product=Probable E3 ubiquitin-protein ligase HERC2, putative / transcript_product=Probable E3 ubiquitin-protein ligase HERC2, putative / location=Cvel_scaffold6:27554-38076(+) / protein_length=2767 / sequence_SO=supercontig / SO=protein_coding / is_pseudo=false
MSRRAFVPGDLVWVLTDDARKRKTLHSLPLDGQVYEVDGNPSFRMCKVREVHPDGRLLVQLHGQKQQENPSQQKQQQQQVTPIFYTQPRDALPVLFDLGGGLPEAETFEELAFVEGLNEAVLLQTLTQRHMHHRQLTSCRPLLFLIQPPLLHRGRGIQRESVSGGRAPSSTELLQTAGALDRGVLSSFCEAGLEELWVSGKTALQKQHKGEKGRDSIQQNSPPVQIATPCASSLPRLSFLLLGEAGSGKSLAFPSLVDTLVRLGGGGQSRTAVGRVRQLLRAALPLLHRMTAVSSRAHASSSRYAFAVRTRVASTGRKSADTSLKSVEVVCLGGDSSRASPLFLPTLKGPGEVGGEAEEDADTEGTFLFLHDTAEALSQQNERRGSGGPEPEVRDFVLLRGGYGDAEEVDLEGSWDDKEDLFGPVTTEERRGPGESREEAPQRPMTGAKLHSRALTIVGCSSGERQEILKIAGAILWLGDVKVQSHHSETADGGEEGGGARDGTTGGEKMYSKIVSLLPVQKAAQFLGLPAVDFVRFLIESDAEAEAERRPDLVVGGGEAGGDAKGKAKTRQKDKRSSNLIGQEREKRVASGVSLLTLHDLRVRVSSLAISLHRGLVGLVLARANATLKQALSAEESEQAGGGDGATATEGNRTFERDIEVVDSPGFEARWYSFRQKRPPPPPKTTQMVDLDLHMVPEKKRKRKIRPLFPPPLVSPSLFTLLSNLSHDGLLDPALNVCFPAPTADREAGAARRVVTQTHADEDHDLSKTGRRLSALDLRESVEGRGGLVPSLRSLLASFGKGGNGGSSAGPGGASKDGQAESTSDTRLSFFSPFSLDHSKELYAEVLALIQKKNFAMTQIHAARQAATASDTFSPFVPQLSVLHNDATEALTPASPRGKNRGDGGGVEGEAEEKKEQEADRLVQVFHKAGGAVYDGKRWLAELSASYLSPRLANHLAYTSEIKVASHVFTLCEKQAQAILVGGDGEEGSVTKGFAGKKRRGQKENSEFVGFDSLPPGILGFFRSSRELRDRLMKDRCARVLVCLRSQPGGRKVAHYPWAAVGQGQGTSRLPALDGVYLRNQLESQRITPALLAHFSSDRGTAPFLLSLPEFIQRYSALAPAPPQMTKAEGDARAATAGGQDSLRLREQLDRRHVRHVLHALGAVEFVPRHREREMKQQQMRGQGVGMLGAVDGGGGDFVFVEGARVRLCRTLMVALERRRNLLIDKVQPVAVRMQRAFRCRKAAVPREDNIAIRRIIRIQACSRRFLFLLERQRKVQKFLSMGLGPKGDVNTLENLLRGASFLIRSVRVGQRLVEAVVKLQSAFRARQARMEAKKRARQARWKYCASMIQRWWRRIRFRRRLKQSRQIGGILFWQCVARTYIAKTRLVSLSLRRKRRECAIRIQCWWRLLRARWRFWLYTGLRRLLLPQKRHFVQTLRVCRKMQGLVRGWQFRRKNKRIVDYLVSVRAAAVQSLYLHRAARRIQAFWRAYFIRSQYRFLRMAALTLQPALRTLALRARFTNLRRAVNLVKQRWLAKKDFEKRQQSTGGQAFMQLVMGASARNEEQREAARRSMRSLIPIREATLAAESEKKVHSMLIRPERGFDRGVATASAAFADRKRAGKSRTAAEGDGEEEESRPKPRQSKAVPMEAAFMAPDLARDDKTNKQKQRQSTRFRALPVFEIADVNDGRTLKGWGGDATHDEREMYPGGWTTQLASVVTGLSRADGGRSSEDFRREGAGTSSTKGRGGLRGSRGAVVRSVERRSVSRHMEFLPPPSNETVESEQRVVIHTGEAVEGGELIEGEVERLSSVRSAAASVEAQEKKETDRQRARVYEDRERHTGRRTPSRLSDNLLAPPVDRSASRPSSSSSPRATEGAPVSPTHRLSKGSVGGSEVDRRGSQLSSSRGRGRERERERSSLSGIGSHRGSRRESTFSYSHSPVDGGTKRVTISEQPRGSVLSGGRGRASVTSDKRGSLSSQMQRGSIQQDTAPLGGILSELAVGRGHTLAVWLVPDPGGASLMGVAGDGSSKWRAEVFGWGDNAKGQCGSPEVPAISPADAAAIRRFAGLSGEEGEEGPLERAVPGADSGGQMVVPSEMREKMKPLRFLEIERESMVERWGMNCMPPGAVGRVRTRGPMILRIAAGDRHSLALCSLGLVWSWGDNESGQCGEGPRWRFAPEPRVVRYLKKMTISSIAAGPVHSAAVCEEGRLYVWGSTVHLGMPRDYSFGSCCEGPPHPRALPIHPLDTREARDVAFFFPTYIDLDRGRQAHTQCDLAWNVQEKGTEVRGGEIRRSTVRVAQVFCGPLFSVLRTATGEVYAWGRSVKGVLGNGEDLVNIDMPGLSKKKTRDPDSVGGERWLPHKVDTSVFSKKRLRHDGTMEAWDKLESEKSLHTLQRLADDQRQSRPSLRHSSNSADRLPYIPPIWLSERQHVVNISCGPDFVIAAVTPRENSLLLWGTFPFLVCHEKAAELADRAWKERRQVQERTVGSLLIPSATTGGGTGALKRLGAKQRASSPGSLGSAAGGNESDAGSSRSQSRRVTFMEMEEGEGDGNSEKEKKARALRGKLNSVFQKTRSSVREEKEKRKENDAELKKKRTHPKFDIIAERVISTPLELRHPGWPRTFGSRRGVRFIQVAAGVKQAAALTDDMEVFGFRFLELKVDPDVPQPKRTEAGDSESLKFSRVAAEWKGGVPPVGSWGEPAVSQHRQTGGGTQRQLVSSIRFLNGRTFCALAVERRPHPRSFFRASQTGGYMAFQWGAKKGKEESRT